MEAMKVLTTPGVAFIWDEDEDFMSMRVECSKYAANRLIEAALQQGLKSGGKTIKITSPEIMLPQDIAWRGNGEAKLFESACFHSIEKYKRLVEAGVPRESVKTLLPGAILTQLNIYGHVESWKRFVDLRESPTAQWEVLAIMSAALKECRGRHKAMFKDVLLVTEKIKVRKMTLEDFSGGKLGWL